MAHVLANRVKESTATTGTGAVTLLGAATGYQSFAAVGNANTCYYTIAQQSLSEWEVGVGTYTAGTTSLSRDTVIASSNAGALVNFSTGIKDVFVTAPTPQLLAARPDNKTNLPGSLLFPDATEQTSAAWVVPSGTAMLFKQTAAPVGWTKVTTTDDAALRVVAGTAGSGGTAAFSTTFASRTPAGTNGSTTATNQAATATNASYTPAGSVGVSVSGTVGSTTLDGNTLPSHNHLGGSERIWDAAAGYYGSTGDVGGVSFPLARYNGGANYRLDYTSSSGASWSHTHSFSGSGSGSFTGNAATIAQNAHNHVQDAHTHAFTGTAMDFAVKYIDVIVATKN